MKEPKKNILVSFSGGETSAYMINWLLLNKPDHNYKFIFANTGEENEETLIFAENVAQYFGIDLVWVEYERLSFKRVNYQTAYRSHDPEQIKLKWPDHPFRKFISHFGIPNVTAPNCTKELKLYPINRYMSSIGWTKRHYSTAIGIRADEIDRVGKEYYPLVRPHITKQIVNAFWEKMPFRLQLKGYEGNCKTCYKKSLRKLVTIARHNPEKFAFTQQMELEYGPFKTPSRVKAIEKRGGDLNEPTRFFRQNKTVEDIFMLTKDKSIEDAKDDSTDINYQLSVLHDGSELDISNGCSESCEVFE